MASITVIKRDGSEEPFDVDKISASIMEAAMSVGGENVDLADQLADEILGTIEENDIDTIEADDLQKMVEKTLIENGHAATAKQYILVGADRSRMREMDSSLMKSFEEITFTDPENSEVKRENANIDSSTAMGTMLKYGSEGAKNFNLLYMMSQDTAEAHRNGDIHIHDLDFLTLTETCVTSDSYVTVKINNEIRVVTVEELMNMLGHNKSEPDKWYDVSDVKILSNNEFVSLNKIVKHRADNKRVLSIKTHTGELKVTDDHRVSVLKGSDIIDVKASELKVDDILSINSLDKDRYNKKFIDIIELYNGDNLVIANTSEVIHNIKSNNNWKYFCEIFDYRDNRALLIRSGRANMTIAEYKSVEHLTTLTHSDIRLKYKRSRGEETINAIVPLTFELGNIIGLMYSEGSLGEYLDPRQESLVKQACFCNYDEDLIEQFNRNYATVFNNAVLKRREHKGKHTGTVLSGYLQYELFHGVFGVKESTQSIRLADWMYEANSDFVSGLIAGIIDGDGTVQKDGYRVNIASISIEFLTDIQKLLLLRGIKSIIKERTGAEAGTVAHFVNDDKDVDSIRGYSNYILEFTGDLSNKLGWVNSNKINAVDLKSSDKFVHKLITITGIDEIEYDGYVYDMETENHHFTVNGFNVHNCCQIPIDKLFKGGFNTGHGFLREPGGIRTAGALAAIAIQSNQNDQHGGQSIPMFDFYLAPYVALSHVKNIAHVSKIKFDLTENQYKELKRKLVDYQKKHKLIMSDNHIIKLKGIVAEFLAGNNVRFSDKKLESTFKCAYDDTYDETYQSMEAFIHNLNTMHSRAGAQVPFSSINYGTDTSVEGRMVMHALLDTTEKGLGNGETPIFPIQIFKLKSGVSYNKEDPNYDLFVKACKVSAKRLYPNFDNLDAPYNKAVYVKGKPETEVAYMGCRTRVATNVYDPNNQIVPGRGNLSFTSINLPRLAIEANGDVDVFFHSLDKTLELVHKQLLERFEIQCKKHPLNYPFLMGQGVWLGSEKLGPHDDIRAILKHGTLTVGFIGLAECLVALIGKHHGESEEAQELGLKIIGRMREYTDAWSQEEHMNYSVIGTPAEGLSGRFVRIDKQKYGTIPGVTDREYYTNSSHVPVYYPISATKKIEIEAPYHALENGGHIAYIEMDGDPSKNIKAFMKIVRYMHDKGVGYGAVNHPVDRDPVCGYVGIIGDVCPRCGRRDGEAMTMEMWAKIKGYANVGNADTLGYPGDIHEEDDRTPNT